MRSVGYDNESKTLEILLRNGGMYAHFDVPESVYSALLAAVSKSKYYNDFVKRNYAYVRKA